MMQSGERAGADDWREFLAELQKLMSSAGHWCEVRVGAFWPHCERECPGSVGSQPWQPAWQLKQRPGALEGKFSVKNKSPGHPHTNMAKAALNMMTHTACKDERVDSRQSITVKNIYT